MSATETLDTTSASAPDRKSRGRRFVRLTLLLVVSPLLASAIYAHAKLWPYGKGGEGILAVLDRVFDLSVAIALLMFCFFIGRAVASRLSLDFSGRAEETVFSTAIGAGITGLCLFLLGVTGLLKIIPVSITLALLAALSFIELRIKAKSINANNQIKVENMGSSALDLRPDGDLPLWLLIVWGLFVLLLVTRAITPPFDWEDMVIQMPASRAFVEHGRIIPFYDNPNANNPFLEGMLYVVCIMLKTDIAPKLINLGLALVCNIAVFSFAERFISRRAASLALVIFWGAQAISEVVVGVRTDMTVGLFLFLAMYAAARWSEEKRVRWLFVSAGMCGFGLGVSHSGIYWLFVLALLIVFEGWKRSDLTLKRASAWAFIFFGAGLAIGSPWYIKNIVYFHNPVYPLITQEAANYQGESVRYFDESDEQRLETFYQEALLDPATRDMKPDFEMKSYLWGKLDRNPLYFWRLFTYPEQVSAEVDLFPNYLFLFLPVYIFLRKNRYVNWQIWLALGLYVSVCLPYREFSMRYLLPAFPGLTLAVAYCFQESVERFKDRTRLPLAALAYVLTVLALVSIAVINIRFLRISNSLAFVSGQVSRAQFLAPLDYYRPLYFIGHSLPEDAKVMLINSQYYYDVGRPGIENGAGSLNTAWRRALVRTDSLSSLHDHLKSRGVTHLLAYRWNFNGIANEQQARQAIRNAVIFKSYKARYLEEVACDLCGIKYILYRLK